MKESFCIPFEWFGLGTWSALWYSKGSRRELEGHSKGNQWHLALRHLRYWDTWQALGHSRCTWAPGHSKCNWTLRHSRDMVLYLTDSANGVWELTLFRMGFFGAAHGWGGGRQKGPPPSNLPHLSYNDETSWYIPWVLLTSAFFTGNQQILLY